MEKILVTGAAGFIGYHLCERLLAAGYAVYGIDNLNTYYDVGLKLDRLEAIGIRTHEEDFLKRGEVRSNKYANFIFRQADLVDDSLLEKIFSEQNFDVVINLAAQAGVRYSIENPKVYVQSNVVGFINVLEACRHNKIKHLIYASSSSVYGNRDKIPFSEADNVDHPVSLYAATKKSNELMAHTYSSLYNLPTTGLRFFTVYGPWGRPDMAPFLFTKAIFEGKEIKVFNNGDLMRDFTYIDDIVDGVFRVAGAKNLYDGQEVPYGIFNIGNSEPVKLIDFIKTIEKYCGKEAVKSFQPMQPGDVYKTYADTSALEEAVGYASATGLDEGIKQFVNWYRSYYGL